MTEEKKYYTRLCTGCEDRGGDNWSIEDPAVIVRVITEINERGQIYNTEDIEQREVGLYGVSPAYNCSCGSDFSPPEWRDLEVVEVEQ